LPVQKATVVCSDRFDGLALGVAPAPASPAAADADAAGAGAGAGSGSVARAAVDPTTVIFIFRVTAVEETGDATSDAPPETAPAASAPGRPTPALRSSLPPLRADEAERLKDRGCRTGRFEDEASAADRPSRNESVDRMVELADRDGGAAGEGARSCRLLPRRFSPSPPAGGAGDISLAPRLSS
jgi:hypothetical protein